MPELRSGFKGNLSLPVSMTASYPPLQLFALICNSNLKKRKSGSLGTADANWKAEKELDASIFAGLWRIIPGWLCSDGTLFAAASA